MTKLMLRAGVGEQRWEKLIHNIARKSEERIAAVLELLQSLYNNEWAVTNETWTLPNATEEMWDNMETLFEEVSFPDHERLKRQLRALKARWIELRTAYKERFKRAT